MSYNTEMLNLWIFLCGALFGAMATVLALGNSQWKFLNRRMQRVLDKRMKNERRYPFSVDGGDDALGLDG